MAPGVPSASECQKGRGGAPGQAAGGGAQAHIVGGCSWRKPAWVLVPRGGNVAQGVQTVQTAHFAYMMAS